jgi:hypothetical protein
MGFQLSQIIKPQFVANGAAAALQLTTNAAGTQAPAVPVLTTLTLWTARFTNILGAPVTLKVWRVPAGAAADDAHIVINTITLPVATANNPYFDWSPGYQLGPVDAIFAEASGASAIVVTGDGGITT